jgi:hypothetical protein
LHGKNKEHSEPALGSPFLLNRLDVLAAVTIEDVNVRHAFQVNVANKVHCCLAAGALHLSGLKFCFYGFHFFSAAETTST